MQKDWLNRSWDIRSTLSTIEMKMQLALVQGVKKNKVGCGAYLQQDDNVPSNVMEQDTGARSRWDRWRAWSHSYI